MSTAERIASGRRYGARIREFPAQVSDRLRYQAQSLAKDAYGQPKKYRETVISEDIVSRVRNGGGPWYQAAKHLQGMRQAGVSAADAFLPIAYLKGVHAELWADEDLCYMAADIDETIHDCALDVLQARARSDVTLLPEVVTHIDAAMARLATLRTAAIREMVARGIDPMEDS